MYSTLFVFNSDLTPTTFIVERLQTFSSISLVKTENSLNQVKLFIQARRITIYF